MAFNTITFLFFFFPVTLFLFFLTPKKYRQYTLLITSFIFYCWGDTKNLIFILFSALFSYLSAIEIENLQKENKDKENKIVFITTIIAHIGLLAFFKYAGLMSMPLGISFYTFSVLSYIFDVYYGKCGAENNILNYLLYVSFFPKVISGPIIQFHDFKNQLANRIVTRRGVVEGTQLFMLGLFKKVLLADQLGMAYSSFAQTDTVVGSYFTVISYGLQLYFDFSGYSDMAIGIFGFHFGKNFDEPYTSHSISEFWRRWHISLGAWFRDYVYIPLGGNRVDTKRHIMNLLVVWLLTGIWHGNTLGFIIWGLYHGFFVIGEKYFFHDLHQRIKPGLQVALTQ
ncbi:MBOAT family O-acyltransferase [Sharpea azabuensis]|uniref:MBOAT family O-acyltransferase n=1 Tax=Sharpea azabuensis TaxID=322505 RepID=UPI001567D430|nr:MBOAT family protein [Sharpea azabuensis]